MDLSSDSVIPTYASYGRTQAVAARTGIETHLLHDFEALSGSIGGMMLFPGFRVDGRDSINQARGTTYAIGDRLDLTLECVRRYYLTRSGRVSGPTSPLAETLLRYSTYFDVFGDFDTYVDHFLLQDLVVDGEVQFFLPLRDFERSGLPLNPVEYGAYMHRTSSFVRRRNARMRELIPAIARHDGVVGRAAAGPCSRAGCARVKLADHD